MTSTTPSGMPGNSLSRAAGVADDDRLGHAEAADPSGEGLGDRRLDDRRPDDRDRTRRHGSRAGRARRAPWCRRRRRASPATGRRARPASTSCSFTQSSRSFSVLLGEQWRSGRAQFVAGLLVELGETVGRAAGGLGIAPDSSGGVDLAAPVDIRREWRVGQQGLRARRPVDCRRHMPSTPRSRWAGLPVAAMAAATRDGPSRLTSTAASSGESKLTVAAEWMTTSHVARTARPSSSRPRPSTPTSPAMALSRRATISSNPSPSSRRSRSKASLRTISRRTRSAADCRRPGRTSSTTSQSGTDRSRRSTRAVPRNPVAPVTAMRLPASASVITGAGPRVAWLGTLG